VTVETAADSVPDQLCQIRDALKKAAPQACSEDLDRFATSIKVYAAVQSGGQLYTMKRGTEPARKSLQRLNQAIIRLASAIEKMGADELLLLRCQEHSLTSQGMMQTLASWNLDVVAADGSLAASAPVQTRMGRPTNVAARRLATQLARAYQVLAGSRATVITNDDGKAEGPFLGLVAAVFKALKLDAQPERYARDAVAEVAKDFKAEK
jgi:hypothetical protein